MDFGERQLPIPTGTANLLTAVRMTTGLPADPFYALGAFDDGSYLDVVLRASQFL